MLRKVASVPPTPVRLDTSAIGELGAPAIAMSRALSVRVHSGDNLANLVEQTCIRWTEQ